MYVAGGAAATVVLMYAFGYDYLFNGIAKTYLKGKTSANIDDGKLFPNNVIKATNPKPWIKDSLYNVKQLPKNIVNDLTQSKTAAFVVIKDGKLLHEQYWDGYNATSATNSFSMAKAVTVMLLGKAIEDDKITSIHEKYSTFYPEYKDIEFANELTLEDLAKMESGLDWDENYNNPFLPNAKAYYGKSIANVIRSRKFIKKPGTAFEYQSGSTQMLGFALRKALNQPLGSYLSEKFWTPLGMEQDANWSTDENGMEKTFCCIQSNAKDFAKLGQLFLDQGKVGEYQIISQNFLREMSTPTEKSQNIYGMGLWINKDNPIKHYYFLGLQGQYIIMIPEYNMVIVRTGSYENLPKNDRGRPDQVKFLVNETVKAFN